MSPTLSKKEIARQIKEIRSKIADSKDNIKGEFGSYRKASKIYIKATAVYKKAKDAYDNKPKAKQERKLDEALDRFYAASDAYKEVYRLIESYFDSIEKDYNEICDLYETIDAHRKIERVQLEFERYRAWLEAKLANISDGVPELVEDEDDKPANTEDEYEELEELDTHKVEAAAGPVAVSPVSISPVILDISSIVENAVNSTMDKFNAVIDKRLAELVGSGYVPGTTVVKEVIKETVSKEGASSDAVLQLEGDILTKEQEIYNKLLA